MKVLIKSTRNLTNYYVHAYETWKKALEEFVEVRYYGEGYDNFLGWEKTDQEVYEHMGFTPDIELWCGGPGNKKPQYIDDKHILRKSNKNIPKLILLCDYWEIVRDSSVSEWHKREEELKNMGVVGYFSFYSQTEKWMQKIAKTKMTEFITFPYIYDDAFDSYFLDKKWDVNNQGVSNGGYPFRQKVRSGLLADKTIKTFVVEKDHHYKMLDKNSDPLESYFHGGNPVDNFAKLLNSCWITITDGYAKYCPKKSEWNLDGTDMFLAKYPQVFASNSVLFCPEITSDHIDGLIDGFHYVAVNEGNFIDKIKYYLNDKSKLIEVSDNASDWVLRNCSKEVVGLRVQNSLKEILK